MTDAIAVSSTLIAAAGLGFSGWQLRLIHKDRREERALGIQGVCLSWRAVVAPNKLDVDADGLADWVYEFTLDNPGRFPISNIVACVEFPAPVSRIRHNGALDPPSPELELEHPVLPGGGSFAWSRRHLRTVFDDSPTRRSIQARVSFQDAEGARHTTRWPAASNES